MNMDEKDSPIDVLLITAVKDELDVVRKTERDWQEQKDSKGFFLLHTESYWNSRK